MVCLDTSFIIDLLRGNNGAINLKEFIDNNSEIINIPSMVVTEIVSGLLYKKSDNELKIVDNMFSSFNILNFDKESAFLAGEIESSLIKKGEKIDIEDIIIAATTIINKDYLVTSNIKHFSKIHGLNVKGY